jgi:hypothetical protein
VGTRRVFISDNHLNRESPFAGLARPVFSPRHPVYFGFPAAEKKRYPNVPFGELCVRYFLPVTGSYRPGDPIGTSQVQERLSAGNHVAENPSGVDPRRRENPTWPPLHCQERDPVRLLSPRVSG